MRKVLGIGLAVVLALPVPVLARSQAQLDCGVRRAPAGLGANLAAAIVAEDFRAIGPLRQQLGRIIGQCVAANRMTDAEGEAYEDYLTARLPRDALMRQLGAAGVPVARVDAIMGYGPGQPNRLLRELSSGERDQVMDRVRAAVGDEARLGQANWDRLNAYMDLTPRMFRALALLQ